MVTYKKEMAERVLDEREVYVGRLLHSLSLLLKMKTPQRWVHYLDGLFRCNAHRDYLAESRNIIAAWHLEKMTPKQKDLSEVFIVI